MIVIKGKQQKELLYLHGYRAGKRERVAGQRVKTSSKRSVSRVCCYVHTDHFFSHFHVFHFNNHCAVHAFYLYALSSKAAFYFYGLCTVLSLHAHTIAYLVRCKWICGFFPVVCVSVCIPWSKEIKMGSSNCYKRPFPFLSLRKQQQQQMENINIYPHV